MGKYGKAKFDVFGKLVEVPRLETTKSGFELAKFEIEVITRNPQTKEEKTTYVPITAMRFDAKAISNTKYVKAGDFFYITGNINTSEYTDKNGNSRLSVELVASSILGGSN